MQTISYFSFELLVFDAILLAEDLKHFDSFSVVVMKEHFPSYRDCVNRYANILYCLFRNSR